MERPEIRIGTSSFSEADWVGPFYPSGTRPADFLRYYTTQFSTVEIDASYYAVPSIRTVERWREICPPHFILSAKFPRTIVHGGDTATPNASLVLNPEKTYSIRDQFLESMSRLGSNLGPLVLQFHGPGRSPCSHASSSGRRKSVSRSHTCRDRHLR